MEFIVSLLSYLTVLADVAIILFLLYFLFKKDFKIPKFFRKNSLLFAFIVALVATLGSLFFSEILGYSPCKLCWFQRIFMYPLVILFGMGLVRKSKSIMDYGIVMSIIGAVFAGYHYFIQKMNATGICSGDTVECIQRFIFNHEYVTIPMMALTSFVLIIIFGFIWRGYVKE